MQNANMLSVSVCTCVCIYICISVYGVSFINVYIWHVCQMRYKVQNVKYFKNS